MSIIASPTLSSDVRHKATGLLRQMYTAYSEDKANSSNATGAEKGIPPASQSQSSPGNAKGKGKGKGLAATAAASASIDPSAPPVPGQPSPTPTPGMTEQAQAEAQEAGIPTFIHPDPTHLNPATQAEARSLESQLDQTHLDDRVEDTPVSTDEVLRVHGIYMNQRRHFEIRVDHGGRLVLWDSDDGKVWGT